MSTRGGRWQSKQAHRVIYQPVSVVLQYSLNAWLKDCLPEISADLREAVAHQRRYTKKQFILLTLRDICDQTEKKAAANIPIHTSG